MGKAAIFLATGFEEIEAISVIDILRRKNVDVEIISVSGMEYIEGAHGIFVKSDALFFSIDYSDYELFILPGGMPGATNLMKHEGLCELLKTSYENGKKVAAICAAPSVLGEIGILNGKKVTCYPGFEKQCIGAEIVDEDVVVDGNITTARGAGVAMEFGFTLLKAYCSDEEIEELKGKMQY